MPRKPTSSETLPPMVTQDGQAVTMGGTYFRVVQRRECNRYDAPPHERYEIQTLTPIGLNETRRSRYAVLRDARGREHTWSPGDANDCTSPLFGSFAKARAELIAEIDRHVREDGTRAERSEREAKKYREAIAAAGRRVAELRKLKATDLPQPSTPGLKT